MKKTHLIVTALVGMAMYMLGQAQGNGVSAAQYESAATDYYFSDCTRPVMPARLVITRENYPAVVERYNGLVHEANSYMRCIRNEAERDMDRQTGLIRAAYLSETALISGNLNALRSEMERVAVSR